jgi:hypothetical protein
MIDHLARFWESVIYPPMSIGGKIGPPPIPAVVMAWINLICAIIAIVMFLDWLRKFFWPPK